MNQTHYFFELLDELHMLIDKHENAKISLNDYDAFRFVESNDTRINSKNYQHKIDKLMYVVMHTRLNFCFSLERFNQYFANSTKHHKSTLKNLFRYIRSTINLSIMYDELENNESFVNFQIFFDSNYATNKLNKKSILKYVYMFVENSIS